MTLTLAAQGTAAANPGLAERPINLTCTAPDRPSRTLVLEPVSGAEVPHEVVDPGRGFLVAGSSLEWVTAGEEATRLRYNAERATLERVGSGVHGIAVYEAMLTDLPPVARWIEDGRGGLWLETDEGVFLRVEAHLEAGAVPTMLSQTGCFEAGIPVVPAQGLVPYAPVSPLWTDGAGKRRWIAMPDWHQPGTTITLDADGDFDFPAGTVLVKEFALDSRLVETRLLVRHLDGVWAGYTYEWNEAQTDAELLMSGKTVDIDGQAWQFPSPTQCTYCHAPSAGSSIGPEVAQLNSDVTYPSTGITANQLTTLESIGLFSAALPAPVTELPALVYPKGSSGTLDDKARAYLHANCGYCHRPGGNGRGPEDFRYWVSGQDMGAWNVAPTRGDLGIADALLLFPGEPDKSILSVRMQVLDGNRMPIIGSLMVDDAAIAIINDWIDSGTGFGIPDSDTDGFADNVDNCSADSNPDQVDSDGDGFGNACDPDLNNDNAINFTDLGLLKARFFTNDPDADFNVDGGVNFLDLAIMKARFFGTPGPGAQTD
ncbi:MAG: hypothetical protein AAFN78_05025 [Pseudomonadota bacterium]